MPQEKAHENFTDPDSRIMKRAGGGFDPSYNAQTAVDEAAHIIVSWPPNWIIRPGIPTGCCR